MDVASNNAMVKIAADIPMPVPEMCDLDSVRSGGFVFAFGSPLTLANSLSFGVIAMIIRGPFHALPLLLHFHLHHTPVETVIEGAATAIMISYPVEMTFSIQIRYAAHVVSDVHQFGYELMPYVGVTLIGIRPQLFDPIRVNIRYRPIHWLESHMHLVTTLLKR